MGIGVKFFLKIGYWVEGGARFCNFLVIGGCGWIGFVFHFFVFGVGREDLGLFFRFSVAVEIGSGVGGHPLARLAPFCPPQPPQARRGRACAGRKRRRVFGLASFCYPFDVKLGTPCQDCAPRRASDTPGNPRAPWRFPGPALKSRRHPGPRAEFHRAVGRQHVQYRVTHSRHYASQLTGGG